MDKVKNILSDTGVSGEQLEAIFERFSDYGRLNETGMQYRDKCREMYVKETY